MYFILGGPNKISKVVSSDINEDIGSGFTLIERYEVANFLTCNPFSEEIFTEKNKAS